MNQLTQTFAEDSAIATGAFAQSSPVPIDNEPSLWSNVRSNDRNKRR